MTTPTSAKGRATRQRLLDAAAEQMRTQGSIDISTIAQLGAVTPSVLYRYFDGRDGLVTAVVEDFYDAYEKQVFSRRDMPGKSWHVREAVRMENEIAFFYDHRLGRAVASGLILEPAAAQVDAARTRTYVAAATRNIRSGQRTGQLPTQLDAGLAGAAIIGAVRSMLAEALGRTPPAPQHDVCIAAIDLGAAILRPMGPTPTPDGPRVERR